jgi:hypothetical protein
MFDLIKILESMSSQVDEIWNNSKTYGEIELISKRNSYEWKYVLEPKKSGGKLISNYEDGIYIWTYGETVMYVGKTNSPSMSIHKRQKNHLRSFIKTHETHESSGRKYREFLKENSLQKMRVRVKYISVNNYSDHPGMIELIESASIFHYKPLLNEEVKGKGKRF